MLLHAFIPSVVALVGLEDDQRLLVRRRLDAMGHASMAFQCTDGLLTALDAGRRFHLVVLDRSCDASGEGLHAVQQAAGCMPVLLITDSEFDALRCEWKGHRDAIDVVASPLNARQFERSMLALVERWGPGPALSDEELVYGNYRFLVPARVLLRNGQPVSLRPREFDLALLLFRNIGRLLSRDWLWSAIWGRDAQPGDRSLDVYVARLRKSLGLHAANGMALRAVYGRGYRLEAFQPLPVSVSVVG